MTTSIDSGTWVEIHSIVLQANERAPQVPQDTQRVPLEMRVKGFLMAPASIGEDAEIETPTGRRLHGRLSEINPPYTHSFGPPIPELSIIGKSVRALLRDKGYLR